MIFIVDDRFENIYVLRSIFEQNGFNVDEVIFGEEVFKKVLIKIYFLIIFDVQMFEMDGFEIVEFLGGFSKLKDIFIIFFFVIFKEKKFIVCGYEFGVMDYIIKFVDLDIFLMKVCVMVQFLN